MNIECPQCKVSFTVSDTDPGDSVQCPSCDGRINMPALSPTRTSDDEFPLPFRIFIVVIALIGLFFPLAAMTTPAKGAGIVTGLGLTLLAVWKRHAIDQYFKQRQRLAAENRAAKKEATAQAAAGTASAPDGTEATTEPETPVSPAMSPAAVAPAAGSPIGQTPGDVPKFGPILGVLLGESAEAARVQNKLAPTTPAAHPATPAAVFQKPAVPVPTGPVTPPVPELESLTAGLPEKYQAFLDAAMTQSKWSGQELAARASTHHLDLVEAINAINQWSQERFRDPLLVQEGDDIRVQLPNF